jgi:hypothetical protein
MTRSISFSRPMTGSSLFSRASCVRLRPNWSRTREPPAPSPGRLLAAAVAGQELDDLLTNSTEVGAQLDQDLGGYALALADEPEQDVLCAYVVVAELQRFTQRELEHLLRSWCEGDVSRWGRLTRSDDLFHLLADLL